MCSVIKGDGPQESQLHTTIRVNSWQSESTVLKNVITLICSGKWTTVLSQTNMSKHIQMDLIIALSAWSLKFKEKPRKLIII